jgi:hypothetical protein
MKRIHEKLKYGSDLHNRVRDAIGDRFDLSRTKLANRFNKWREAEDLYFFYVKMSEAEQKRKNDREKTGKQAFSTIYIPYSYASLMSAFTYWSTVFLSRTPIFQVSARHGEAEMKVLALEALLDYQQLVGQMLVPLYIWLLDAGKYGVGILGMDWIEENDVITTEIEVPKMFGDEVIPGEYEWKTEHLFSPRYKGNKLFNIRPYDFLPDPKVSFINLQQGEFCGRVTTVSWNEILRRSSLDPQDGGYFNIEELRKESTTTSALRDRETGSTQVELPDDDMFLWRRSTSWERTKDTPTPMRVELVQMVVEMVPKHWGIGESSYPEKWVFTVGNREVVIGCRPLGARHGMFPYFIQSYEPDSYSFASRGLLEILKPLNDTLTWLFNSRMYNVRKANVDQLIVDPSRIVMKDLLDGEPGKLVRLRPEYYGTDVRQAITPLPVLDVTQSHIKIDAGMVMELMQRVSGVNDNNMGVVFPGGRKTATEIRTSASFGINRLKTISEFNSALGWAPLVQALIQNTQQYMDEELEVKIAGSLLRQAKTVKVRPEDIAGFYDFVPVDGTLPIDRYAIANLWKELLQVIMPIPQIAQKYDLAGIFTWMAQQAGLKNIDQFEIKAMPDANLLQQVSAGNLGKAPGGIGQGIGAGTAPNGAPGVPGTPEFPGLAALLGGLGGPGQGPETGGI